MKLGCCRLQVIVSLFGQIVKSRGLRKSILSLDLLIGNANVFLQSLSYALDFDDKLAITDYKGTEEGSILINVTPCLQNGKPLDEDYFVEDPKDLIGKPYHFKVTVRNANLHKVKFSNLFRF